MSLTHDVSFITKRELKSELMVLFILTISGLLIVLNVNNRSHIFIFYFRVSG